MNEHQVLRILQQLGPLSRAEVVRQTGLSAPTVSKAAAALLKNGFLEEHETPINPRGRPAKRLRIASQTSQVLGVVIDRETCQVVVAGLDGKQYDDSEVVFATPENYEAMLETIATVCQGIIDRSNLATMAVGISMPGLIDYRLQKGVLSPNVPQTDGRTPASDLSARIGCDCVLMQECHALCLAERHYGLARELDNFAMLEAGTGVGLGVMSGGSIVTGHNGLAGEIGHMTVVEDGRPCGCGNQGCLETVASDSALAWRVSNKLGKKLHIDRVIELVERGEIEIDQELNETGRYLAIGLAAVINLFNPATLFVHGRQFDADPGFFNRLVDWTRKRTLPPSFAECRIVQARGSKKQGAIAAAIQHLTSSIAPALSPPMPFLPRIPG